MYSFFNFRKAVMISVRGVLFVLFIGLQCLGFGLYLAMSGTTSFAPMAPVFAGAILVLGTFLMAMKAMRMRPARVRK
jgi:hypothetical protein